MKQLLIVWHSRTGAARAMAETAALGARGEAGVRVRLAEAAQTRPADLLAADGYLFAAPENLGALSGQMKEFLDRTYYEVLDALNGRPYGLMIAAGSDGTGAERQFRRIATGWRLRLVADPIILVTQAQSAEAIAARKSPGDAALAPCRELGAALSAGLALGVF